MSKSKSVSVTYTELKQNDRSFFLLHPTMTDDEIIAGLEIAKKYNVATACKTLFNSASEKILSDSDVLICPVIGFPHGNNTTETKVF